MTTTPSVWKGLVQANTSDGGEIQSEGQVAGLPDGEYVVVWADNSHTYNSTGSAIVARRIDYAGLAVVPAGNLHGGEVKISQFNASGNQLAPAVAVLSNGNVAVAFHNNASTNDVYVRVFDSALNFVRTDIIDTGSNETYFAAITALAGGAYAVSYELGFGPPNSDIAGRIVDASGNVGSQFNIDNQSDNQSSAQLATLSNGNFVAVYQDELNGNAPDTNILVKIFTPAGTLVAGPGATPFSADSGRQTDPDVGALRDGGFVMVWSDDGNSLDGLKDIRRAELADQGQRRLQRRPHTRHPVAGCRRHARDLDDERRLDRRDGGYCRPVQSGTELADQGHGRLQRRHLGRHSVAEHRRHASNLADERHECRSPWRRRPIQSGAELARRGHGRLQRRQQGRHRVAERRRHAGDLAHGRPELHLRKRGGLVQSRA
jgi:hypothetical protein